MSVLFCAKNTAIIIQKVTCDQANQERALANCGPTLWNQLPIDIRTVKTLAKFKTLLKTYLFNNYYSSAQL